MKVTGVAFVKAHEYGDFEWMVKQKDYEHVLFLFNENFIDSQCIDAHMGAGSAVVRPMTHRFMWKPRAVGIPTGWCVASGGFHSNDKFTRLAIDNSIERVKCVLHDNPTLTEIMFSCTAESPNVIGSRIFCIDSEVIKYISNKLQDLRNYDSTKSPKSHEILDANEQVLLIHANLHRRIAFLENELRSSHKKAKTTTYGLQQTRLTSYI